MQTINLNNVTFNVRPATLTTIKELEGFTNIQEMLVEFFETQGEEGVYTDEYALAIRVYFPNSKAWGERKQLRCATDVRKYNKGEFRCQGEMLPDTPLVHKDGGVRRKSTVDPLAAKMALDAIEEQLG